MAFRVSLTLFVLLSSNAIGQLLRPDVMNLGVYNPDTKQYEKKNIMLGGDDHDRKPYGVHLLGGDDHDRKPHGVQRLGGDDHDRKPHGIHLLGGDDHDRKPHGIHLLGGDDHDRKQHGVHLIGGDDHDRKPHGVHLLGGDDHDRKPHGVHLIGGDDHDRKPHGVHLLGEDNHDFKPKRLNSLMAFRDFIAKHNRTYDNNDEFRKRFTIFRQNLQRIHQLRRNERGSAIYGATKFADFTDDEFQKMLGFRPSLRRPSIHRSRIAEFSTGELPPSFDWRQHGAVTAVKNQGSCGSCWAFSTTGNVEGQWYIKNNHLISLSEQELVDCDTEDQGCNGGLPENAYDAIMKLGGIEDEKDYPYNGKDGKCKLETGKVHVTVNGSVELPQNEEDLARWLVQNGPISIGINANALQFYMGGVSHPLRFLCNPEGLNHGMLIVGYGTHTTKYLHRKQPYWLIKNSWGRDWGEQGYYRVYRGDGTCGLNRMATSAIVP